MEVVSNPSLGRTIGGTYSYTQQNNGRPMYKHDKDADICLFHWDYWKVELCKFMTDSTALGFLLSKVSSQSYPQDAGQAWSYYDTQDTVDTSVVVKCSN